MPGLIPLVLRPAGPESSTANRLSISIQPSTPRRHSRQGSIGPKPSTPKTKSMRRLSQPSPPALPILPYTAADWRRTLSEVKRLHMNRKFRACASKCRDILDSLKGSIEPVYLIYLNLYAATSLEMCARPLRAASTYRASLLQRAQTHYDAATSLISEAEESAVAKTHSTPASSTGSSPHSPSSSISSQAWTADTAASSPTDSISSMEDLVGKSQAQGPRKPVKKKVTFCLPAEPAIIIPDPFIRPDSPTLGFDDEFFRAPSPVVSQAAVTETMPPKAAEVPLAVPPPTAEPEVHSPPLRSFASSLLQYDDPFDLLRARSVHRYCEHLSVLKDRLAAHAVDLQEQLARPVVAETKAAATTVAATTVAEARPSSSSPPQQQQEPQPQVSATEGDAAALPVPSRGWRRTSNLTEVEEQQRLADRQVRIERLRKAGWQRKRFDARRYADLRHAVLAELD